MVRQKNTFHFESFKTRVAKVGGDAAKWSAKLAKGGGEGTESFFLEAITKWNDMDHGQDYLDFIHDLPTRDLHSCAQVLHSKDVIMHIILKHLALENSRSRLSIVEIAMGAIRDFRESFDDHIFPLLEALLTISTERSEGPRERKGAGGDSSAEVQLLETVFLAVTLLARYHADALIKDTKKTFGLFLPVLATPLQFLRRFAAESFSVILRKMERLDKFAQLAVLNVDDDRISDGVALLFFYTLRGTNKQLHSRAAQKLSQLLAGSLDGRSRDTGVGVVQSVMEQLAAYANVEDIARIVVKTLLTHLSSCSSLPEKLASWKIIVYLVTRKIYNMRDLPSLIAGSLLEAMQGTMAARGQKDKESEDEEAVKEMLELLPQLVLPLWQSVEHTSALVEMLQKMMEWMEEREMVFLLEALFSHERFDVALMPLLGKIAASEIEKGTGLSKETLGLYATLCHDRRPIADVHERGSRIPFCNTADHVAAKREVCRRITGLHAGGEGEKTRKKRTRREVEGGGEGEREDQESIAHLLLVWPWLHNPHETPAGIDSVVAYLRGILTTSTTKKEEERKSEGKEGRKRRRESDNGDEMDEEGGDGGLRHESCQSDIVLIGAASLYAIDPSLLLQLQKDEVFGYIRSHGASDSAVRVLWLWLQARNEWTERGEAEEIAELLGKALLNPRASVRKTILECLAPFQLELPKEEDGKQESESAFAQLLSAEKEVLDLGGYRKRMMYLRKLQHPYHKRFLPEQMLEKTQNTLLRAILSQLFERFTIMWPLVHEVAVTYANGLKIDEFWTVMKEALDMAAEGITRDLDVAGEPSFARFVRTDNEPVPDYISFRGQLFKFLAKVPEVAERRTRLLSPIVLSMYQRDFLRDEEAKFEVAKEEGEENEDNDEEEEEEKEEETETVEKEKKVGGRKVSKKSATQSLVAALELYSKFSNLTSVYLAKQIRAMLDELLLSVDLQKVVLACIIAYKNKTVLQYKENLERLIGEKTFRDELTLFQLDDQDSALEAEHRAEIIPIFLRIVLGMLRSRLKTYLTRRTALLGAIAGCRPDEIHIFITILFQPIMPLLGDMSADPLLVAVQEEMRDKAGSIALPRISWAVQSVSKVLNRLAPSISEQDQALLLRLLHVSACLVHLARAKHSLRKLKNIDKALTEALTQFFRSFPYRPLAEHELQLTCTHVLARDVKRLDIPEEFADDTLPHSAHTAPVSVLKLIASWTNLPQLYSLLNVRCLVVDSDEEMENGEGEKMTPFRLLCESLVLGLKQPNVVSTARTAFSNMLTYADEKQTNEGWEEAEMPDLGDAADINTGLRLVVQQLPFVLAFLLNNIENQEKSTKQKYDQKKKQHQQQKENEQQQQQRRQPQRDPKHNQNVSADLELLSRVSSFIEWPQHRTRFAAVLLKQVLDKPRDSRLPIILTALANFTPTLDEPRTLLHSLAPLFSAVDLRESRGALGAVLRGLAKNDKVVGQQISEVLCWIADCDAWDKARVDEPNYAKRHEAYIGLSKYLETIKEVDEDIITILVHTHVHALRTVTDVALRGSASEALQAVVRCIAHTTSLSEGTRLELVDKHLAAQIVRGFGHKDQVVRDEFIRSFAVLVSECPWHEKIANMTSLRSDDEDLDFFFNIIHIQTHRRQRALKRLVETVRKEDCPVRVDVLIKYIIPLVQPWFVLVDDSANSATSDEALRVLTAVLSGADWKKYISMLDYWLGRLDQAEQRKSIVRVVVAVVDAFHFDVSDEASPIRRKVLNHLLPGLKTAVDGKEFSSVHKKAGAKKYYSEEDDIQRTPVALATAKLLMKLPQEIMDQHLHGLILKLCSLLASRSISVRLIARKTLVQMAETLGPKYVPFIVKELRTTLIKGYQVHVQIFTVHTLLSAMQMTMGHGDLDSCVDEVVESCCEDLFGHISEEKQVGAIREATMEAKASKSLDTLQMLARFISSPSIGRLLHPLEEALDDHPDSKTHKAVGGALREIAAGLKKNQGMDHRKLLIFVHHQITTNMEKIQEKENALERLDEEEETAARNPESCLIVPKAPKRVGVMEKTRKGQAPVLLEFGLQLLAALLGAATWKEEGDAARLDPFLPLIMQTLQLKYEKVVSHALRAALLLLPKELPSLPKHLRPLADRLFALLSTYAGFASGKGTALSLNQLLFKTMAAMIKHSKQDIVGGKRLEILLSFVHGDLLETQRQATAFALLKAIVQREMRHPQLRQIMNRVEEMSIQSEIEHVRAHCRQLLLLFIGSHPDGRDVEKHVNFLLAQLEYESEDGRLSAIETLHALFGSLVQKALDEVALTCVVRLSSRLVSEEGEKGKTMVALATRRLLGNISDAKRNDAFLALKDWLNSEKDGIKAAGASLLLQFCLMEGGAVKEEVDRTRLTEAITIVADALSACSTADQLDVSSRTVILLLDSLSVVVATLGPETAAKAVGLKKAFEVAGVWSTHVMAEAKRPAAGLLGNLLAVAGETDNVPDAWSLFEWAVWPLAGKKKVDTDLSRQSMKNCLAVVDRMDEEEIDRAFAKLVKAARFEISRAAEDATRRSCGFKIAAATALRVEGKKMESVLDHFIPLLLRELNRMSDLKVVDELYSLSQEVMEVFKKRAGDKVVTEKMIHAQKMARERKDEKKAERMRFAAINPDKAAAAVMEKNKRRKEAKQRKWEKLNPAKAAKKRRVVEE